MNVCLRVFRTGLGKINIHLSPPSLNVIFDLKFGLKKAPLPEWKGDFKMGFIILTGPF
jgi:hypothetical protein